ncbi:MAG TPA: carboxylating nicotinate-nucleotide diphosphorylase [Candidatus Limnocylindrales bacterium]|jgi:nicotinate-nucleotide pyrophosphorylase (carboxylating)|nr:carboxylating nicotinate-nucleotide diphosphorylase [Candidatus Limnocylindrales bacterium]
MEWHSRRISAILENALLEDKATSDATTRACIDPQQRATATILAKQDSILSGVGAIARILEIYETLDQNVIGHPEVISHGEIFDGVRLKKGQVIAVVRHNARVLLSCERVILNILQRLGGIATYTRQFVEAVQGTSVKILDTRKTVPGLRVLDKYAVRCGGGHNHRLDLSDGVLIKNNHIALAGGVAGVLHRAIRNRRSEQPIVIEVRNLAELEEALANGAEQVLLDNMTVDTVKGAVERVKEAGRKVPLEVSGGIRLDNVREYAETGVDYISVGVLTHSPRAVDLSMRIVPA